jgi:hypothetical protein
MYQNTISELPKLRNENYANIFNVYTDKDGYYFYNLLQTVVVPDTLPAGYYEQYSIEYGDTWPLISYKKYQTPNLWWLITSANNIINPTQQPEQGTQIKVLKSQYASLVVNQISTQEY